jgi:hypothetical protein
MQKPHHHLTQKTALDAETPSPPHAKDSARCRNPITTSEFNNSTTKWQHSIGHSSNVRIILKKTCKF